MRNKVLFALILVLVSPLIVKSADNSLKKGAWALQFTVDRNFSLTSFQGSTFTIKKHTSDAIAYRLGISTSFEYGEQDFTSTYGDTSYGSSGENRRVLQFGFNLLRVKYTSTQKAVNFFWGLGPRADYTYNKNVYPNYANESRLEKTQSWSAGLSGVLGVEWFAIPSISLLAEYSSSIVYKYSKQTSITDYNSAPDRFYENAQGSVGVSNSGVRFGLSAYF